MDISHDIWIYGFITQMVNPGLQGFILLTIAYSCYNGDCNCMLWILHISFVKFHGLYTLYTNSVHKVIFFFWLCCAHIHSIVCHAPGLN